MKLEHTPALAIALRRGLLFAEREGLSALAPVHLLRGLLAEEEGHCVALLRQAGFDLESWRRNVGSGDDAVSSDELPDGELRVAASVRHILNLGREQMSAIAEEGSLASDQVLLALLEDVEELRRQLQDCGLDYRVLRQRTTEQAPPLVLDGPLLFDDPRERIDAARIVDASANRAREALRWRPATPSRTSARRSPPPGNNRAIR
jgi:ATP-dependent Clp protease ATP-binding subunit ClpA